MVSLLPGAASVPFAILADIKHLGILVREIVFGADAGPLSVPYVGGCETHVDDLTAELVQVSPATLAAVSLHLAAGDGPKARETVIEGLGALLELRPNAFSGAGPAKALYRACLRKMLTDQKSADSTAAYVDIDTARREARKIADERGWLLSEMESEATSLDARLREEAAARSERFYKKGPPVPVRGTPDDR